MGSRALDVVSGCNPSKQREVGGLRVKKTNLVLNMKACVPVTRAKVLPALPYLRSTPVSSPTVSKVPSSHGVGDFFTIAPPPSLPKKCKNRVFTPSKSFVSGEICANANELRSLPLRKERRHQSMPLSNRSSHATACDAGSGDYSRLLKRHIGKGGWVNGAGDSNTYLGSRHCCVNTMLHEKSHSRESRSIRFCDSFEDFYQLVSDVMPSVHCGMEIKRAVAKQSQEEMIVKIRWKGKSFRAQGEETAWRASTELMLNLPPCRSIVRVHEVLETPDAYFLVMEKAGGKDLYEHLDSEGAFPVEEVRDVLRQLLTAVAELHSCGCIHKDIKLENVMLDRTPSICVGSWSTAPSRNVTPSLKISSISGGNNNSTAGRRIVKLIDFDTMQEWSQKSPKASDVLGTDQYIAPEAYEGSYSPASDIFAVGVLAYKLLSGSFPFSHAIFDDRPGENWVGSPKMQQIRDKLQKERIDWGHQVFRANPSTQQILARMMAINEACRPSAREALADPWLMKESLTSGGDAPPRWARK